MSAANIAALPALRTAYDAYMAAKMGQLHATADDLTAAAHKAGWSGQPASTGRRGMLPWVREQLGESEP